MTLLLLALALAAPVPKEAKAPPFPGEYAVSWGGEELRASFDRDNLFEETNDSVTLRGVYLWEGDLRRLTVYESSESHHWCWSVVLDAEFAGTTDTGVAVKLIRR